VTLRSADEEATRRYENPVDFEQEAKSSWAPFDGAGGVFHDSPGARVSLVSTATTGDWDRRRFRANVYLDGEGEDAFVAVDALVTQPGTVRVGDTLAPI
jgi:uncharacterized protein